MKAWRLPLVALLAVALPGFGACSDPPRRPPVAYVPIVRAPEPPPASTPASTSTTAPSEKEAASPTPPPSSTGDATPVEDLCFRKLAGGCCGDTSVKAKIQRGVKVCPPGTLPRARCKARSECVL